MRILNKNVAALFIIAVAALGYLTLSGANLLLNPTLAEANIAPDGTLNRKSLGQSDYVWNWDFLTFEAAEDQDENNVDWGMRFIFHENANVDYVTDRIDGAGADPHINPQLTNFLATGKYAHIDDGPTHVGSNITSDRGLKTNPGCAWNFGHMRFYANSGVNYNSNWGYYIVASSHRDHEWVNCDNKFSSLEYHEGVWGDRIEDYLGSDTEYDWTVVEDGIFWDNAVT